MRLLACLLLALAACDAVSETDASPYGGFCQGNGDCAAPFNCRDSVCVCDACEGSICSPGKIRCSGDSVEQCSDPGDRWEVLEECPTGCSKNACRPAACVSNERRCDGTMTFQCLSNGSGWVYTGDCAQQCKGGTCDRGACACP